MLNGKFISIYEIIDSVYAEIGIQKEIPWEDCISWAGEALDLINAPYQYIKKVTGHKDNPDLDITNYRAKLPCDLHRLEMIAVNGFPARYSGNTFHQLLNGTCCGLGDTSSGTQDIFIDNFGNSYSPQSSVLLDGNTSNNPYLQDITFDINNDFISLSVKTGKVCIAYLAVPTDDNGFPMIPDDTKYKLAIRKYLIKQLMYMRWIENPDSNGIRALFNHAETEWCWYVGSAGNQAKMPDISRMESIKNNFLRMIPKINEFNTAFKTAGHAEQMRIH